jgi:hypothetical protein
MPTPAPLAPTLTPTQFLTPMPTRSPTLEPTLAETSPQPPPICLPIADCGELAWCSQEEYKQYCEDAGMKGACPAPFCKTPVPTPAPTLLLTPAPTSATTSATPAPTSASQGSCAPTNEGVYNDPAVYGPWCEAAAVACPAPMCRRVSSAQR